MLQLKGCFWGVRDATLVWQAFELVKQMFLRRDSNKFGKTDINFGKMDVTLSRGMLLSD